MFFLIFNAFIFAACSTACAYSLSGRADKQFSNLLYKVQFGVFAAWCCCVGAFEVFAALFRLFRMW